MKKNVFDKTRLVFMKEKKTSSRNDMLNKRTATVFPNFFVSL